MASASTTVSLAQLIQLRDIKRNKVTDLCAEKRKIDQQIKAVHEELFQLDEQIDNLEEQQLEQNRPPVAGAAAAVADKQEIKQEQGDGDIQPALQPVNSSYSHRPQQQQQEAEAAALTMNRDEILTEPSQYTQTQQPLQDEEDDPIVWTQTQQDYPATSSAFTSAQQQEIRRVSDDFPELEMQNRKPAAKRSTSAASGPMDNYLVSNNNNHREERSPATSSSYFASSSTNVPPAAASAAVRCPYSTHDITQTLRQSFRLQTFRENQLEIIQTTLSGKDCFVLMKTGGGKSLLYQLPAVLESPKITLVVSPLLSLIQDQENQMNQFVPGSCVSFTSGMGQAQHTANWQRVRDPCGGVMMILVTPERVFKSNKLKDELQKLEEQNRLGRFVIDECHCACQWGHDFRPDYAKISVLRQHFPGVPTLAVTATASDQVRNDCANIFQLARNYAYFRSTANRPNLRYQVRPKESASCVIDDMVQFINDNHPRSAGIVYTYSRKDADTVAEQLCDQSIIAESYHSDVSPAQKRDIHESWMRNETQVVVATIAFGLGINKPDVRFVLHHTLSKTLEAYYQESGRAGRDGKPSDCVLYYSAKDVPRMIRMINGDTNAEAFNQMVRYAQQFGDDDACRGMILRTMGEPNQTLDQCNGLNEMVEKRDVTSHAKTVLKLLRGKKMTMPMLLKEWRQNPKTAPRCVQDNPPGKDLSPNDCERIIIGLFLNKLIYPVLRSTKYDTVVDLQCTRLAGTFTTSDRASMKLPLPKKVTKKRKSKEDATESSASSTKKKKAKTDSSAAKKKAKTSTNKRGKSKAKSSAAKGGISGALANSTNAKQRRATTAATARRVKPSKGKEQEVIDLLDDSDNDSFSSVEEIPARKANLRKPTMSLKPPPPRQDPNDSIDDDSEFEFE